MVVTKETGRISNLLFADTAGFYFSFSIFPLKPESPDQTSGYTFPHGAVGRPLLTARSLHFSVTLSRRSHLLVALFKYIYLDADRFRDQRRVSQILTALERIFHDLECLRQILKRGILDKF